MQRENGNKNVGQAMPDSKGNSFWKNEIRLIIRQAEPDLRVTTTNGFTLIELLVVVLIIGILAAVALPQYQKAVKKARGIEAITTLRSIVQAELVYHMSAGEFTSDLEELPITVNDANYRYHVQIRTEGAGAYAAPKKSNRGNIFEWTFTTEGPATLYCLGTQEQCAQYGKTTPTWDSGAHYWIINL